MEKHSKDNTSVLNLFIGNNNQVDGFNTSLQGSDFDIDAIIRRNQELERKVAEYEVMFINFNCWLDKMIARKKKH